MDKQGRAVAKHNNEELLEALVAGRKEIRDVFIGLDRCFEWTADVLRERPDAEPHELELGLISMHAGFLEHALKVLMVHLDGYEGSEVTVSNEDE